jgi:WD40 repeat protein
VFDPDGRRLVLSGSDEAGPAESALTVFDAAAGAPRLTIRGATCPLAFSPDGRCLIALDPETGGVEARVFDLADGRELARLRGHTGPILAASFSRDGARIVTSSRDGAVKVWDPTGRELLTLADSGRVLVDLRFGPDGIQLLGVDEGANVLIWEGGPPGSSAAHRPPPIADP